MKPMSKLTVAALAAAPLVMVSLFGVPAWGSPTRFHAARGLAAAVQTTGHGVGGRPLFNGDAFDDVAVGVPGEDVSAAIDAGAVNVIYGSPSGLTSAGDQFVTQGGDPGIQGTPEAGDEFGAAVATGDFDADGFGDLAVGAPGEDVPTLAPAGVEVPDAGAVSIIYGSAGGLVSSGNQTWTQEDVGGLETSESGDMFGAVLRSGDFDGDGFSDLAIGIPFEDVGSVVDAGSAAVLYGSSGGLTSTGAQVWTQDSPSIQDQAEAGDQLGAALAGGTSFDGGTFTDLAIGAPGEDEGTAGEAGGVNVLYGSSGGLNSTGNQFWAQDSPGIADKPQNDDAFGAALTGGSLDDDNFGDLVVGVPGEEVGGKDAAGSVSILFGTSGGLSSAGNDQWTQDSTGIRGKSEVGDAFGSSLRTGKLNGDGIGDVAIGNPGEDVLSIIDAGEISVLFGSASGPNANGDQVFNQNSDGILGTAEAGDAFGTSLKAGNFQGDSFFDIVVGVPGESVNGKNNAGQINVLFGATNGLTSADDETWQQDKNNINDSCETGDSFGFALS